MNRTINQYLLSWKNDPNRLPLLLRGARQVGKSYIIEKLGKEHFEKSVTINFDLDPQLANCFAGSLEPKEIISSLSIITGQEIVPGKTLLFLDEIQQCPRAIMALRYFYEKLSSLHVIGAGSLLEFALSAEDFRMPVGRIQYAFLYPLTFSEFCNATGQEQALKMINEQQPGCPYPEAIHNHLIKQLHIYMITGGMPGVIQEYINSGDLQKCSRLQAAIVQTYRDDFGKYASKTRLPHVQNLFAAAPKMIGRKFKYSTVDDSVHSRELKAALELLEKAGILYRVKQTSGSGLPLEAGASERNFKIVFLDVGLMQNMCGLSGELLSASDMLAVYSGAVAEQFVGQELIASADPFVRQGLYYWAREARTSNAEVDYLFISGSKVLPLEVKAGMSGTLRSLHLFISEYKCKLGLRVSQNNQSFDGTLLSAPLYAMHTLLNNIAAFLGKTDALSA